MTVYVDDMRVPATIAGYRGTWSHLMADTREELHQFAGRLGLRREWFQDDPVAWHYDITEQRRQLAIRLGAQKISFPHGTGELIARRRAAMTPKGGEQ